MERRMGSNTETSKVISRPGNYYLLICTVLQNRSFIHALSFSDTDKKQGGIGIDQQGKRVFIEFSQNEYRIAPL